MLLTKVLITVEWTEPAFMSTIAHCMAESITLFSMCVHV